VSRAALKAEPSADAVGGAAVGAALLTEAVVLPVTQGPDRPGSHRPSYRGSGGGHQTR